MMKYSSLINIDNHHLLNYYRSPVENCVSMIAMTESFYDILGLNCFGELLLKTDFEYYAENTF